MGAVQRLRLAGNVVVSNVARVPVPLWSSGAPVLGFYSIGTITDGAALNFTYLSYDGRLQLSILADALAVPAPDAMHAALEEEWAHLCAEVGR
jgi:hypothetical protein